MKNGRAGFRRTSKDALPSGGRRWTPINADGRRLTPFMKEAQEDAIYERSSGGRPFCKKLRRTPFPKEAPEVQLRLSERPSGSFTSGGFLREASPLAGRTPFPKEAPEVPEGSNLFQNVLREASPLAAFRRKRTSFGKLHLWRLPSESFTSGASFGKTRVAPLDLRLRDPLECRLTICFPKAS